MHKQLIATFLIVLLALTGRDAFADRVRIRDLVSISGIRENALIGYGVVVGLDGSGDQTMQTPFTTQALTNMLSQLGVALPAGKNMQLKNVAAVMVTARLPAFAQPGQAIDVVVSSMGNAKSLRGGTLLMTPLKGVDNQVYALAQGNVLVGGAGVAAGGNNVQVNQLAGGRITDGAIIERQLPSAFGQEGNILLQLRNKDFALARNISDAINRQKLGNAIPLDGATVQVFIPKGGSAQVRALADIENVYVDVDAGDAKVIINSRTGSVVMNRSVILESCAIAQGSLSVTVNRQQNVSQPDTPFGGGETVVTDNTEVSLRQEGGVLQRIDASPNLNDVIRALNVLGQHLLI
jgi:flagellar P-ring protein precursor FlgI